MTLKDIKQYLLSDGQININPSGGTPMQGTSKDMQQFQ